MLSVCMKGITIKVLFNILYHQESVHNIPSLHFGMKGITIKVLFNIIIYSKNIPHYICYIYVV